MRTELCDTLVQRAHHPEMVFLTGDLGFMALEPLQAALGRRFINAGIAEQNMVSVAAAMVSEGLECWTYTIAPFCYARAFEQIRNDVCMHRLAVKLLANGGGYGYGVMGPTHHALEDYGSLLTLPHMQVLLPCFNEDVAAVVSHAAVLDRPAYIRLGRGELPAGQTAPDYAPWRCLLAGPAGVIICAGPIAGQVWALALQRPPDARPSVWVVSELPLTDHPPPAACLAQIGGGGDLAVIEEHVAHGGVAAMLAQYLLQHDIRPRRFHALYARGYPSSTYGSQQFLRAQGGLGTDDITAVMDTMNGGAR